MDELLSCAACVLETCSRRARILLIWKGRTVRLTCKFMHPPSVPRRLCLMSRQIGGLLRPFAQHAHAAASIRAGLGANLYISPAAQGQQS